MNEMAQQPPHVPADRVVDFDFMNPQGASEDVHCAWAKLHDFPDLVWSPYNGGHWIATRADVIEQVQTDYAHFSHSKGISLPMGLKPVRYLPLESDPPEHTVYRHFLNPAFGPARIAGLKEDARALAIELIEQIRPRGECEFIGDFAEILPVTIFLRIVDLPLADREKFIQWATEAIRTGTPETRRASFLRISAYLSDVIEQRRRNPGDDLISRIATHKFDAGTLSHEQALGMMLVLFIGGLDTVVNMLAFFALFLARNPDHRQRLAGDVSLIPTAIEELVRRHGLTNTVRTVTTDFEFHGVQLKAGDIIQVPTALHGLDDRRFDRPAEVDFDRSPVHHATFGNGPHRCIGAPLGRAELAVFLEEWLKRIPDFSVKPGTAPVMHSNNVLNMEALHLVWN